MQLDRRQDSPLWWLLQLLRYPNFGRQPHCTFFTTFYCLRVGVLFWGDFFFFTLMAAYVLSTWHHSLALLFVAFVLRREITCKRSLLLLHWETIYGYASIERNNSSQGMAYESLKYCGWLSLSLSVCLSLCLSQLKCRWFVNAGVSCFLAVNVHFQMRL